MLEKGIFNLQGLNLREGKDIIERFDESKLFSFYLDNDINNLNKLYTCPFHEDSSPSMGFYQSSKYLMYKCFGCGATGNIFEFIKNKYNLDYGQSIDKIRRDFLSGTGSTTLKRLNNTLRETSSSGEFQEEHFRRKVEIYPKFRNWSKVDFDYWNRFYIPLSLLNTYEINPCSSVYIRDKSGEYYQYCYHKNSDPIYHYNVDGSDKVYRPLHPTKKGKWMQNCSNWDIQGLKQLPKYGKRLFITSSLKDVMVLNVLGEWAVAPHGEGILIPDKIIDYLFATWEEIIVFYDNDEAGVNYAKAHSNYYNIKSISIPYKEYKDPSDFVQDYGIEGGKDLIKELCH